MFTGTYGATSTGITSPIQYQQTAQVQDAFGQAFAPSSMQTQPAVAPLQPQSTNPFRKSMMQQPTGNIDSFASAPNTMPSIPQNGNPFARQTPTIPPMPNLQQQQMTGGNPFAHANHTGANGQLAPIQVQPTGSTNPFRQSMFVNQQTGSGWQNTQTGTMGGLEQLPTVPIFPRPGATTSQSGQGQSPWN